MFTYGRLRMSALGGIIVSLALLANPLAASAAAGWSPEVVISPSQPSPAPNAFVINPAGNELWVMAPGVVGGYMVEAAQRSFGGAWSPLATVVSVHTGFLTTPQSLSASISANGSEVAAWVVGGIQISFRSASGVWQAPVSVSTAGSPSSLLVKLDAQGNGVAVWSEMTGTASVVKAVTWNAAGAFGTVVQLSQPQVGQFAPDLAVNDAGTAVVVWTAAAPGSTSTQIESTTRPAGGNWGAMTAVSPILPFTSSARVALDGSGDATVVWQQGTTYGIYAATRSAGGAWSNPTEIETSNNVAVAGQAAVATDSAGNATATWMMRDATTGVTSVRAATRPAGSSWGAPTTLGSCGSTCVPHIASASDGSITVVGWAPNGPAANAAIRLGLGTWVSSTVGSGNAAVTYVVATNNAGASAVWPVGIHVAYHLALKQSDYR